MVELFILFTASATDVGKLRFQFLEMLACRGVNDDGLVLAVAVNFAYAMPKTLQAPARLGRRKVNEQMKSFGVRHGW